MGSESFQVGECMEVLTHKRGHGKSILSPYIALCISSIWLLLSCIFCNKLGEISKHFPELCEPFYQVIKLKEGVMGTPNLFKHKYRRLGLKTGILREEVGYSCGTTLNLGS